MDGWRSFHARMLASPDATANESAALHLANTARVLLPVLCGAMAGVSSLEAISSRTSNPPGLYSRTQCPSSTNLTSTAGAP
jgi:hypothetical protein